MKVLKNLIKGKKARSNYGWFGDYLNWSEASDQSQGYGAENILNKTKDALLKVKSGQAVYERDSVIFDKKLYPFPLIASLLHVASANSNKIDVVDFGGSLGSTWYQVKDYLSNLTNVTWSVVEQKEYVNCGKTVFEDRHLKFYYSIEECIANNKPDVIILSSVIQYLEKPFDFLNKLLTYNFDYILIDRTAFIKANNDRLTRQIVPPQVYQATYPAWFFNEEKFLAIFLKRYEIIAEFTSYVESESTILIDHKPLGYDKGFFLKRIG